ncbi:hypothetical protein [Aminobacter sp. LjRoot7]|uniref:hypothetical protein n=1 Tax=Aminobacter sp. LjRoot7 TaxID=3342335 RepID=UPI003ECF79A1
MKAKLLAAVTMLAVAGCASQPVDHATTLSPQDPKWRSAECAQARAAAANYAASEKETMSVSAGLLLGPYGLGIAMAGKQHQAKMRKQFARDMHLKCSSKPLPASLAR